MATVPWAGQVSAALLAQPWMTGPDLAAWVGRHPVSVCAEMTVLPWAGRHGSTVVAPATVAATTTYRLLGLEQTGVLTTLLARFDPGGRHRLRAEPGGPPTGAVLLRLADDQRQGVLAVDRPPLPAWPTVG